MQTVVFLSNISSLNKYLLSMYCGRDTVSEDEEAQKSKSQSLLSKKSPPILKEHEVPQLQDTTESHAVWKEGGFSHVEFSHKKMPFLQEKISNGGFLKFRTVKYLVPVSLPIRTFSVRAAVAMCQGQCDRGDSGQHSPSSPVALHPHQPELMGGGKTFLSESAKLQV